MKTILLPVVRRRALLPLLLAALLTLSACNRSDDSGAADSKQQESGNEASGSENDAATPGNELSGGFFARASADLLGSRSCGGTCWDYYYFLDDRQVVETPPPLEGEQIECAEDGCLAYKVNGDKLEIGGESYSLEISEKGIAIDGDFYARHEPLDRPSLEGLYTASNYTEGQSGVGLSTGSTLAFRPDGTFLDDSFLGVSTDGSEFGDGTGIDSTHLANAEAAGTYSVVNYTIQLTYKDGNPEHRAKRKTNLRKMTTIQRTAVPTNKARATSNRRTTPARPNLFPTSF
ncbi:hypothetical protein QWJ34_11710 [Saccharibacillus sp. CPCC 101409]|uniref:hypothetical protein n=1 Tax=Saccharibacillus sp. CPCC 101409 TaxID=3058041 RepID=UPI0026721E73|nr:hypothetical protein [Saccharibacillus sp. CPCC 101409]MDO3410429.1 hypothetical protein [Saccharibacillus sp. CPCC 101409]